MAAPRFRFCTGTQAICSSVSRCRLSNQAHERLLAEARDPSTTLAQYIPTRCGFEARNTSLPNTEERDMEEDDAWDRLKRLGLKPEEYFPSED